MEARIDRSDIDPGIIRAMLGLEHYLATGSLDKKLLDLVRFRVSQMNGCAYCLDMHWKEMQAEGETEQRMYSLDAWRECPYYTDRERAALAWTEAVTLVSQTHVPDPVFEQVRRHFSEEELVKLTLLVATINAWNRMAISFRYIPPAKPAPAAA